MTHTERDAIHERTTQLHVLTTLLEGGKMSSSSMAWDNGLGVNRVRSALLHLQQRREVTQVGRDEWSITAKGERALADPGTEAPWSRAARVVGGVAMTELPLGWSPADRHGSVAAAENEHGFRSVIQDCGVAVYVICTTNIEGEVCGTLAAVAAWLLDRARDVP